MGNSQEVASSNFMKAVQRYSTKPNAKGLRRKKPKLELQKSFDFRIDGSK